MDRVTLRDDEFVVTVEKISNSHFELHCPAIGERGRMLSLPMPYLRLIQRAITELRDGDMQ